MQSRDKGGGGRCPRKSHRPRSSGSSQVPKNPVPGVHLQPETYSGKFISQPGKLRSVTLNAPRTTRGPGAQYPESPPPGAGILTDGLAGLLLGPQPAPRHSRRGHQGQQTHQEGQPHQLRHLRQLHDCGTAATSAYDAGVLTSRRTRGRGRTVGAPRGAALGSSVSGLVLSAPQKAGPNRYQVLWEGTWRLVSNCGEYTWLVAR